MSDSGVTERIEERLEALGLSMKAASAAAGLGETAVRDLLRRKNHSPRLSTLKKLAPVLKTSVEWLMTGAGEDSGNTAEIVDIWSRIPDAAKQEVLDFARWKARKSD